MSDFGKHATGVLHSVVANLITAGGAALVTLVAANSSKIRDLQTADKFMVLITVFLIAALVIGLIRRLYRRPKLQTGSDNALKEDDVTTSLENGPRTIDLTITKVLDALKRIDQVNAEVESTLPPKFDPTAERIINEKSPEELVSVFKTNATRDGLNLIRTDIGQWMRTSGIIGDITEKNVFAFTSQYPYIVMYFEKEWDERLSKKKRGDRLAVLGRIAKADSFYVVLDHCEIIRHPNDPPPTRAEIMNRLSDFVEEGNLLLRQGKEKTEPDRAQAKNWEMRVKAYIHQNIDEAAAAYFSLSTAPHLYPGLAIDREFVNSIYTRLQRLDELASEVRQR